MKARIDPDELDLEQLKLTMDSPGYVRIAERIRAAKAKELEGLAVATNWENVRFVQGMLAGFEIALGIPGILAKEMRAKIDQKARAAR